MAPAPLKAGAPSRKEPLSKNDTISPSVRTEKRATCVIVTGAEVTDFEPCVAFTVMVDTPGAVLAT